MLLDRERPGMVAHEDRHGRRSCRRSVVLEVHHLDGVKPQPRQLRPRDGLIHVEDRGQGGQDGEVKVVARPDLEPPPDPEPRQVDVAGLAKLGDQEPADQIAREHEEQVNAGPEQRRRRSKSRSSRPPASPGV